MRQQDVFKKIGNILQELNEQYDYLKAQADGMDDLELELFVANANFLSDHLAVLRKLNAQITKSLPPHQPEQQVEPQTTLQLPFAGQVVEPPVAFTEQLPEQQAALDQAPTLEEYYDIEEPAGEEPGVTSPEFVFDYHKEEAGPQEEQDLAAEPQYYLVPEEPKETYTEPGYHYTEPEQTVETYEPPYQQEEPATAMEDEQPVTTFEEREVNQEEAKAEENYLFHIDSQEAEPEVDEPQPNNEQETAQSQQPQQYSFEITDEEAVTVAPDQEETTAEEAPAHFSFDQPAEEAETAVPDQEETAAEEAPAHFSFNQPAEEAETAVPDQEETAAEEAPAHFSFNLPTENPEPEIDVEPETGHDTFSFIRTEPETIRHELTLNEADAWASDDEDMPGTINESYRQADTEPEADEPQPEHTPLQEQTFAEPEPDAPETIVTPEVEAEPTPGQPSYTPQAPEPFTFIPTPQPLANTPPQEPFPTFQLNREPEPEPVPEPEKPLTLNERISAQLSGGNNAPATQQPIKDLKGAINLNDKMLFVRDLFNGYSLAYSEAIEILNRFNNFEDAERFLKSNYVEKNRWADKPGTTEKFFELLKRRFA